jgi:hypothetical protein
MVNIINHSRVVSEDIPANSFLCFLNLSHIELS